MRPDRPRRGHWVVTASPLLPRARRASRRVALGAVGSSLLLAHRPAGRRLDSAVVLGALALGMPHGAADTELLRSASHGSRARHALLLSGYALLAAGSTVVVRRGGRAVEWGVLVASAAHFAEGELACWGAAPQGAPRRRSALRLLSAAVTTVALPAAVGIGNRRPTEVGLPGALVDPPPRATGERTGLALLQDPAVRRSVAPMAALAAAAVGALALSGDREAAADSVLLGGLPLLAPPATAFAAYFGGWHALRHTARVVDVLVADGQLSPPGSLPRAAGELTRRSAWAAAVGLLGAAALAVSDPERASDHAFAVVLGLTVPHMTTVALELSTRGR